MVHFGLKLKKIPMVIAFEKGYNDRMKGEIPVRKIWESPEAYIIGVERAEAVLKKYKKEPLWLKERFR